MMKNGNYIYRYVAIAFLAVLMTGCAGTVKNMRPVSPEKVVTSPENGKSMIVFMRPSFIGYAIQSSVFEIKDGHPYLVGIVAAKKKVSYQLNSGKHLFMVAGESADFMEADLMPDRTYYALVTPRMGLWKARFSLKAVTSTELKSPEFKEWIESTEWVEKTAASENWARGNMTSIVNKQQEYYPKWMSKSPSERPKLSPNDGK